MMRIGIIGTGHIAHTNVSALLRSGRVEIAALCNRTAQKGTDFAKEFDLQKPVYTDYREMIETETLDAVLINTPHALHCQQFCDCAAIGLAIMIEKPLCTTTEECDRMLESQQKYNVPAAVCHTQRFLSPVRFAKRYIEENYDQLGTLRHIADNINIHYFHEKRAAWFFDPALAGGGLLMTHGAHQIDRVHYFCGKPTDRVHANFESLPEYNGLDSGYQILGLSGEVSYTVTCSGYHTPHSSTMRLDFENGSIVISLFANGMDQEGVFVGKDDAFTFHPITENYEDAYLRQFNALLDHLEGKPSEAPTTQEAAAVVRTLNIAASCDRK